jgi:hypothetical protein
MPTKGHPIMSQFRHLLLLIALLAGLTANGCSESSAAWSAGSGDYLVCFWNAESLVDDQTMDGPGRTPNMINGSLTIPSVA